jgi:heme exporter protein D
MRVVIALFFEVVHQVIQRRIILTKSSNQLVATRAT